MKTKKPRDLSIHTQWAIQLFYNLLPQTGSLEHTTSLQSVSIQPNATPYAHWFCFKGEQTVLGDIPMRPICQQSMRQDINNDSSLQLSFIVALFLINLCSCSNLPRSSKWLYNLCSFTFCRNWNPNCIHSYRYFTIIFRESKCLDTISLLALTWARPYSASGSLTSESV